MCILHSLVHDFLVLIQLPSRVSRQKKEENATLKKKEEEVRVRAVIALELKFKWVRHHNSNIQVSKKIGEYFNLGFRIRRGNLIFVWVS